MNLAEAVGKESPMCPPLKISALILLLKFAAVAALADDQIATAEELVEKGATEIAHGQLIREINVTCRPLLGDPGCGAPLVVYGEFRRLKFNDSEFVCISFRHWACIESR